MEIGDNEHAFKIDDVTLKRIPLLESIDDESLQSLSKDFDIQHAEEGEVIVHENTTGQNFYIIAYGRVSITKIIDKKKTQLATLEIGDFFGEISLIKSAPTTATVTAKEYCVLLRLSRLKFEIFIQSLLKDHKQLIYHTIERRSSEQSRY